MAKTTTTSAKEKYDSPENQDEPRFPPIFLHVSPAARPPLPPPALAAQRQKIRQGGGGGRETRRRRPRRRGRARARWRRVRRLSTPRDPRRGENERASGRACVGACVCVCVCVRARARGGRPHRRLGAEDGEPSARRAGRPPALQRRLGADGPAVAAPRPRAGPRAHGALRPRRRRRRRRGPGTRARRHGGVQGGQDQEAKQTGSNFRWPVYSHNCGCYMVCGLKMNRLGLNEFSAVASEHFTAPPISSANIH